MKEELPRKYRNKDAAMTMHQRTEKYKREQTGLFCPSSRLHPPGSRQIDRSSGSDFPQGFVGSAEAVQTNLPASFSFV